MKLTERKLYNGMEWATCLYQYRFRMEQDRYPSCPWGKDGWEGWLATIEQLRSPDFADLDSGVHNEETNETILYRRVAVDGFYNPDYFLYVSVANLREKYREMMTWRDFVDGKNVRKHWATCNRKELLEWANKNLDSEETVVRQYIDGEVYGFIVERKPIDGTNSEEFNQWLADNLTTDEDKEWEGVDSCWGFYGDNPVENGMSEHVDPMSYVKADFVKLQKREHDKIQKVADLLQSARE